MRELIKLVQSDGASRSSKPGISRFAKRQQHKIPAKNLAEAFDSVSEDSEVSGNGDFSSSGFSRTRDPELLDSSPISVQSALTQSSCITSPEDLDSSLVYVNHHGFDGVGDSETTSTEAKIAIDIVRKVTTKVLNSSGVLDPQSKKLLNTLTEMVIEMLQTVPGENDRTAELLAAKTRIVCAFCFLCIAAATVMILLSGLTSRSSSGRLTPT